MKAWKSRLLLCAELDIQLAELDAVIHELRLTAADQRKIGSILILSPEICDVIVAVAARDFERKPGAPERETPEQVPSTPARVVLPASS